jgi:hypothetical protein
MIITLLKVINAGLFCLVLIQTGLTDGCSTLLGLDPNSTNHWHPEELKNCTFLGGNIGGTLRFQCPVLPEPL